MTQVNLYMQQKDSQIKRTNGYQWGVGGGGAR